ncbi:hypothetical protein [Peribacillus deserti]|uniref:DUF3899 domain-containing protein n=1 Tax=Peribacillus deserti TaxID=673318 RepID=A0A2N5LZH0_9BACI|nr:hypothetical protein [Peribacillus deserti]PLT27465.1 hypothetical protein CUU66_23675 [Peribacillus deserti]
MNWMGVVCGLIAVFLLGLLIIESSRFKKELKQEIKDDRSLSNVFIQRWERKTSREITLGIITFIFVVLSVVLS